MGQLVAKSFGEFLGENGYGWSGLIAQNCGRGVEEYCKCDKYLRHLDDCYILLGFPYYWDEDRGRISVIDNGAVKYIKQDDVTFQIYNRVKNGKFELEKDLSAEWIRYQLTNIDGYEQRALSFSRYILANYPQDIENRKRLLAQEIDSITRKANTSIRNMEESIAKSKCVEEIARQVREERLIQQAIELGAKDDFKDTTSNDACLKHLTDTFGK